MKRQWLIRTAANKQRKLTSLGITIIVIIIAITALKLAFNQRVSAWQDFSDTVPTITNPSMTPTEIENSLEDILKQYQEITASKERSKKQITASLDKLYKLAANDYLNCNALKQSSQNSQMIIDLTEASRLLTSSLFELNDSLSSAGDLSKCQLKSSKEDLVSATTKIEQVRQELKH
ncbi:hypothetical protein [Desulfosporosinus sp. FKA]|uniref:hypothetical protein n=1 Tax=Desulfosporosinus sp. FKA TaxID=1969834 RepID=UPI000B49E4ED|nr:hypothetical protein [Desulfosporosinus sp. FKA]